MHSFNEKVDLSINFNNLELLDTVKSDLHNVILYGHNLLGKILVIDNEVHHVEKWAPFYHEMITHLPIAFIPILKSVLILGGGSLFAANEILKYKSVKKVILIDHDQSIIELIKRNYQHAKRAIRDTRLNIINNDAFSEITNNSDQYDLIINDSVDLLVQSRYLKLNLIKTLAKKLTPGGVCSDVVYRNIFERNSTLKTIKTLSKNYFHKFSLITVPEYPGIFHVLCLWSESNQDMYKNILINSIQKKWAVKNDYPCQFYNPQVLNYYCYLPNYLRNILGTNVL